MLMIHDHFEAEYNLLIIYEEVLFSNISFKQKISEISLHWSVLLNGS